VPTRSVHLFAVAAVAATFMVFYLVPWTGGWFGGPLKPTVLALLAVVALHLVRVASWPLILLFAFLPFLLTTIEFIASVPSAGAHTPEAQLNRLGISVASAALSPVTLLAPLAAAILAHIFLKRMRPNISLERTRER
jgi:hypothetical protein